MITKHRRSIRLLGFVLLFGLGLAGCQDKTANAAEPAPFTVEVLIRGLDQPWGMAFLPDGGILITEKSGALRLWKDQKLTQISGAPDVGNHGQGGLLDVALHPDFSSAPEQAWVYLSYTKQDANGFATALGRGRLRGDSLQDWEVLFALPRATEKGQHFGSRIAFDEAGFLFLSIGDRGERDRAQDLSDPAGSILRLTADGNIPPDNPFRTQQNAHPAIYSYGHRNPQGLSRDISTGDIWAQEHGPQGGDEINRILAGRNYGWPIITYGEEYGTGFRIGEGTAKPGIEPPLHYWKPSIAPSGLAIYRGAPFAAWDGDILSGALKAQRLVRLKIQNGKVISEHRYMPGTPARIRDVRVGPDGLIYLLTDSTTGELRQLSPNP